MTAKNLLFNDGWQFCLTEPEQFKDIKELASARWYDVEIPHDWLINDTQNLYKSGDGWYRKRFSADKKDFERVFLNFDGVYMDSTLFVNGKEAFSHTYGYSAFEADITDFLRDGENELIMRVRHIAPNSRWYSGAGIFRDVNIKYKPAVFLPNNDIYIHSEPDGSGGFSTEIDTEVSGKAANIRLMLEVISPEGAVIAGVEQLAAFGGGDEVFTNFLTMKNPSLWDFDTPNVYTLKVSLYENDTLLDVAEAGFGYKTAEFSPDKGLVLNGRQIKIHGVCMHHDLGALGAAYSLPTLYRQLRIMKEMGANAIRTSHNMPVKQLMELCDHMGLLVFSESFDCWEIPKTEFDNARFFPKTAEEDVKSWVERDRNHPSLLMWSIGNEISDTNSERGIEITKMLRDYVKKYDYKSNAPVSMGSNFMASENAQKCADELKIIGYNYAEVLYDEHHKKYPDWVIYGSETSSAVRSRGIYRFPADIPLLTGDDLQCSSLDNSYVGWGCAARKAWKMDRDCDFCAGEFVWTGFDYIGEPTPYTTKNSYFGMVDTAGFPKDIYYFYQSVWTDPKENPMLHITPSYWDFNPGQAIDVIIYSNAYSVELFLNGKSLGVQEMRLSDSDDMRAHFTVPFEKGTLSAIGRDEDGAVIAKDAVRTCGDPVKLALKPDKTEIFADGRDISFIEITALDKDGEDVGNASNRVKIEVSGAGRLVGLDNGDSTDYDSFKGDNKRLFSGKLLCMVQSDMSTGEIRVRAVSNGLEPAEIIISALPSPDDLTGVSVVKENAYPAVTTAYTDEIPIRKIELYGGGELDAEHKTARLSYKIFPENATYSDIGWSVVRKNGVKADCAEIEATDGGAVVTALGDGEFFAKAYACSGGNAQKVSAVVPFKITGMGNAVKNAYEFISAGRLDGHYGSAAVRVVEDGAVSGFDKGTVMTYNSVDFGTGADTLLLYVGTCCDVKAEVWDGTPDDGELLADVTFKSNGKWCGFGQQSFKMDKIVRGVKAISIVLEGGIFGGFEFALFDRAFAENFAAENDEIYGDEYKITGRTVTDIGNNVIISWNALDFGSEGASHIVIKGGTPKSYDAVQLRYTPSGGEQKSVFLEYPHGVEEKRFEIPKLTGINDISFVFLPGAKFDFESFKFEK